VAAQEVEEVEEVEDISATTKEQAKDNPVDSIEDNRVCPRHRQEFVLYMARGDQIHCLFDTASKENRDRN
jgi:hypothetical protein